MDFFTFKQAIFWLCLLAGIVTVILLPISVLFHHYQQEKEDRSILYKEFFWLLISGLMILFMVFPAGEQMVEDYLGDKSYRNNNIDDGLALNAIKRGPIDVGLK